MAGADARGRPALPGGGREDRRAAQRDRADRRPGDCASRRSWTCRWRRRGRHARRRTCSSCSTVSRRWPGSSARCASRAARCSAQVFVDSFPDLVEALQAGPLPGVAQRGGRAAAAAGACAAGERPGGGARRASTRRWRPSRTIRWCTPAAATPSPAQGELDAGASTHYGEAIRLDPRSALWFNNRGLDPPAARASFDKAVADFNAAVRLEPRFAVAYHNRGVAALRPRRPRPGHRRLHRGAAARPAASPAPATTAATPTSTRRTTPRRSPTSTEALRSIRSSRRPATTAAWRTCGKNRLQPRASPTSAQAIGLDPRFAQRTLQPRRRPCEARRPDARRRRPQSGAGARSVAWTND